MKRYLKILSLLFLTSLLMVVITPSISSQEVADRFSQLEGGSQLVLTQKIQKKRNTAETPQQAIKNDEYVPVILEGETLFSYSSEIKGFSAEARARQTVQNITKVAKNSAIPLDEIKIIEQEGLRIIATESESLVTVLKADAEIANIPLNQLAEEYLQKVKFAIVQYREGSKQHHLTNFLFPALSAIAEFIFAIALLLVFQKVLKRVKCRICGWRDNVLRPLGIQSLQLLSVEQEASLLIGLVKYIYKGIVVVVLFIYLSSLTRYFPWTQGLGQAIFNHLYSNLIKMIKAVIAYLPSLFTIILTIVAAYYVIRFCRLFFKAIKQETLSLPKFDLEWADPTEKLAIFLIAAFAAAIILPLLPGAQSPAFQGISIFAGALLTLGGASAIANLVGGIVIIYTRAFQVGDYVQIDQVKGNILEKTILSTRIRTSKNKIVTIPNAKLLSSNIENYTTSIRDINQHIILHTAITLGYDVPWREVHQILIEAANLSSLILKEPAPFVLQTSLGDFSVSYELNVCTDQPSMMSKIYSQLHQNIQDKCNEAGIEILSPQYSAIRDGNQNTIPKDYLPQDYTVPGFNLHPLSQVLNHANGRNDNGSSDKG
ncbi:MAG: mechanosensitive ion channel family protein [Cyanobacteria bacterium P01_A01_bin.83]